MKEVAAAIVIYNPDNNFIENIMSYLDQVELVYVIDNSDISDKILIDKIKGLDKVKYFGNTMNLGIATALNLAAEQAISDEYAFLLTMDQDSKASSNLIEKLYSIIIGGADIGIVAAEHFDPDVHDFFKLKKTEDVLFTMTSGNLLNLSAYKITGKFLDKLFIDHVDHEYCLRLKKQGFRTIKTNETFIYHKLGRAVKKKLFGFTLCPSHHSPIRLYYRTRNRFYVNNLYKNIFPNYVKIDRKNFLRELIEIYFFEKDLWEKTIMILHGYIHYKKNIMGKYNSSGDE
jgi:rhamnosyltransferase